MSTPFQLLPAPSAIRWIDAPPSAIGPVWSPWPPPSVAWLRRSNVWPAPIIHTITWMPPSIVHLSPPDAIVEAPATWWRRLGTRVAGFLRRTR